MKSFITTKSIKGNEYPCLMISNLSGAILFMTSAETGIVIKAGDGCDALGEYSTQWDSNCLDPFQESIILEN